MLKLFNNFKDRYKNTNKNMKCLNTTESEQKVK